MIQTPPPTHATQIGLTMNLAGFTIAFGQDQAVMGDADADGNFRMSAVVQWLSTVHLPPCIAERLYEALGAALADYEHRFGDMPRDPNWRRTSENVTPLSLVTAPQAQQPSPEPAPEVPSSDPSPAPLAPPAPPEPWWSALTRSLPAAPTIFSRNEDGSDPPPAA